MSDTVITCPSCGAANTVSDAAGRPAACTACDKPIAVSPPTQTRPKMRLRDSMVDEPVTTVTAVMVEHKSRRKSWFTREPHAANRTEAASSYTFSEERKSTAGRALFWSGLSSSLLVLVQLVFSENTEVLANMATGYLYASPVFALALLWMAMAETFQRLIVLLIMPALWGTLIASSTPSKTLDYILVSTAVAYLAYVFEFLIRGMKALVFQVFGITYVGSFLTQIFFLAGNKDFMSHLGRFPLLRKVLEPTIQTLHVVQAMLK